MFSNRTSKSHGKARKRSGLLTEAIISSVGNQRSTAVGADPSAFRRGAVHQPCPQPDIYDFTRSTNPLEKKRFMKKIGAHNIRYYSAEEALRELWRGHWAWFDASYISAGESIVGAFEWDSELTRMED
jgi:hypothetical protein